MTDMTREYELVEGMYCQIDFKFCGDGTADYSAITAIKLPDGEWLALPAPIPVYTRDLAEFAEAEYAERQADWDAERKHDDIESARSIDW